MVKKKKSKGASLVIVVLITSIILSLGIAMLSMSLMGYKARSNESKRLQNLYESDSGLDIVYNIIRKTSAVAIQKAGNDVKNTTDVEVRDKTFKVKFLNYLVIESTDNIKLESYIRNWQYPEYKTVGNIITIENKDIDPKTHPKVIGKDSDSVIVDDSHQTDESRLTVTASTTFSSKTGQFANTKTIEAQFVIDAPNYSEVIVKTGVDIQVNPVYEGKVITADGDLTASGNVSIDGDVWVKGTESTLNDYSYDKYKGGITLNEGIFNFPDEDTTKDTNEIYTSKTFNVQTNATATVEGNIYSSNTYLGNTSKDDPVASIAAVLEVKKGDVVTNNDLTLNSREGSAIIKKYYGINDDNYSVKDKDYTTDLAARNSSCIIVNNKTSSLKITDEAYIMGLAYIDVDSKTDKYQTAESVAVKGNYVAYTDPGTNENVTLKYYNPLQLIEKLSGQDITLVDKTKHFIDYYTSSNNTAVGTDSKDIDKGIYMPEEKDIYSAGAVVNTKSITNDKSVYKGRKDAFDISDDIANKQGNYAKNVLAMGDVFAGLNYGTSEKKAKESIYDLGNVVRTVSSGDTNKGILAQINFDAIDNRAVYENENEGMVILNKNQGDIIVKNGTINFSNNGTEINLKKFKNFPDDMKGIIVTDGNVTIEENVTFTGNIIAKGNVTIKGNNIKLKYDEDLTRNLHARNKLYFDLVFINPTEGWHYRKFVEKQGGDIGDYYEKDFIKKGTWKVVK